MYGLDSEINHRISVALAYRCNYSYITLCLLTDGQFPVLLSDWYDQEANAMAMLLNRCVKVLNKR